MKYEITKCINSGRSDWTTRETGIVIDAQSPRDAIIAAGLGDTDNITVVEDSAYCQLGNNAQIWAEPILPAEVSHE